MMPSELLPCPFCGVFADVRQTGDGDWFVGCFTNHGRAKTKAEAITKWNTRAPTPTDKDSPADRDAALRDAFSAGVQSMLPKDSPAVCPMCQRGDPCAANDAIVAAVPAAPEAGVASNIVQELWRCGLLNNPSDEQAERATQIINEQLAAAAPPALAAAQPPATCTLCGHEATTDTVLCLVNVPICSDDYHGTRPCGCKCVFAEKGE